MPSSARLHGSTVLGDATNAVQFDIGCAVVNAQLGPPMPVYIATSACRSDGVLPWVRATSAMTANAVGNASTGVAQRRCLRTFQRSSRRSACGSIANKGWFGAPTTSVHPFALCVGNSGDNWVTGRSTTDWDPVAAW